MPSLRTELKLIADDSAVEQSIFRLAKDFSLERVVFIKNFPEDKHALEWSRQCNPKLDRKFDRTIALSLKNFSKEERNRYLRPKELGIRKSDLGIKSIGLLRVGNSGILCLFDSLTQPVWWNSPELIESYFPEEKSNLVAVAGRQLTETRDSSDSLAEFLNKSSNLLCSNRDRIEMAFGVLELGLESLGYESGVYASISQQTGYSSLLAHCGYSPRRVQEMGRRLSQENFDSTSRFSKLVEDIAEHKVAIARQVVVDEEIRGIVCFSGSKESKSVESQGLVLSHLVSLIASSESFSERIELGRRHSRAVSFLYRMNKQLTWNTGLPKLFEIAFRLLQEELSLERQWIGVLNESGTSVTGQAAEGKGWRKKLVEVNIDLTGQASPISKVVETRKALKLKECPEFEDSPVLSRVYSRLELDQMVLLPMLSGEQLVGVFAAQGSENEGELSDEELRLLQSMVNEIAFSILTRRKVDHSSAEEKMRTAGFFASGIAHNFNNLLQGIMGQASLLEIQSEKSALIDSKTVLAAAKVINESALKGGSFVKQLLRMAHVDNGQRVRCEVALELRNRLEEYQRLVGDRISLTLSVDGDLPGAEIDPEQLHRITKELVKNSSDAIESAGEINIHCSIEIIGMAVADMEIQPGEYVCISVKDNGRGMSSEEQKRCFEPFFTTKEVDPGSGLGMGGAGLGLSAAYALAKANKGRIMVDSVQGKGSVFRLYLRPVTEVSQRVAL